MPANYTHTARATGLTLTAAIYNADHQNHIDNMIPGIIDDYSVNVSQMRETMDPGEASTENPAASLAEELKQLRFCLKELKGTTHWYESVGSALAFLGANTFTGLQRIVRSVAGNFLELESTDAGATSGPNIEGYRNSGSPAAADFGMNINFYFKDSAANKQFFGQIYSKCMDPTNGSEDGLIGIGTMRAGVQSDWVIESGTLRHNSQTLPSVDGGLAVAALSVGGVAVGGGFGSQLLHIRDEKANGTNGGTSTAATWTKHTLDDVKTNEIAGASQAASVITLPAGTYYMEGTALFFGSDEAKLRLRNTSDGATLVVGMNDRNNDGGDFASSNPTIKGRFTLAATKNVELQYWVAAGQATTGLGHAASSGEVEIYADVSIWKIQ